MGSPAARGRVLNVGASEPVSILELAERVLAATGALGAVEFVPYERVYGAGFEEPATRRPDTTLLRELTGWRPRRTLDDAIRDVVAHARTSFSLTL